MEVRLYMDVHIPKAITVELRIRGVNVITAQEDGTDQLPDDELLDRATKIGRALVTFDSDLLVEATHRQREGKYFAGVIYGRLTKVSISEAIRDLELIAKVGEDMSNKVMFLPM
jgi:predicted nuclease of predicted toxin-antitoxin system